MLRFWRISEGSWASFKRISAGFLNLLYLCPKFYRKSGTISVGPLYIVYPSARRMTLSKILKISADGWWMVAMIAIPLWDSYFKSWHILYAVCESKPDVGSSKKSKEGSEINSYPIDVLFFSPPERPLMNWPPKSVSWQSYNPNLCRSVSTFSWISVSST